MTSPPTSIHPSVQIENPAGGGVSVFAPRSWHSHHVWLTQHRMERSPDASDYAACNNFRFEENQNCLKPKERSCGYVIRHPTTSKYLLRITWRRAVPCIGSRRYYHSFWIGADARSRFVLRANLDPHLAKGGPDMGHPLWLQFAGELRVRRGICGSGGGRGPWSLPGGRWRRPRRCRWWRGSSGGPGRRGRRGRGRWTGLRAGRPR